MFTHLVFFWLKEGTPDAVRQEMIQDCNEKLKQIRAVRHLSAGRPAMTPRDIVDNSYDVGLCVVYDDQAGHDSYQDDPLHKAFLAKHKEHWKRVQVYDFQ